MLAVLALIGAGRAAGAQATVELSVDTLRIEGRTRIVRVYAPPSAGPGAPLVLALHGSPGTGALLCELLAGRLDELAQRGDLLEMKRVEDVCSGRIAVLTAHPLRRERP